MTLEALLEEAMTLSIDERKTLIMRVLDSITDTNTEKPYDILDFEGVGAELYDGTDAQAYIDELRREWDERP